VAVYVTSDLHGYPFEKFQSLLKKANFSQADFLFILGDVIDRGTDGVKYLVSLLEQPNVQLLLGNHEEMMLSCQFLFDTITEDTINELDADKIDLLSTWMANGAEPTLKSLRALSLDTVESIFEYLREAPLYETVLVGDKDFLLVHAGLGDFCPEKSLSDYSSDRLLWTRPNINDRYFQNVITVFGHTPTEFYGEEYKGRILKTGTWINIDTGAANGGSPMLLRLDDLTEFYL